MPLLNLSADGPCSWDFLNDEVCLKGIEFSFHKHVDQITQQLPIGCDRTVILESSLYPVLLAVDPADRVRFLEDNIRELALAYLKLAIRASDQLPNLTVCTYFHAALRHEYLREMHSVTKSLEPELSDSAST